MFSSQNNLDGILFETVLVFSVNMARVMDKYQWISSKFSLFIFPYQFLLSKIQKRIARYGYIVWLAITNDIGESNNHLDDHCFYIGFCLLLRKFNQELSVVHVTSNIVFAWFDHFRAKISNRNIKTNKIVESIELNKI